MSSSRQVLSTIAVFAATAVFGVAQNIAPAHSGTVHYFEGDVTVDGAKLVSQVARFTDLKEQSVLKTGQGRAEILLTPGVVLRVGENSSVKMLDNRLVSTRVEFLSGTAMLESSDAESSVKDPAVVIIYKGFEALPVRSGIFEITSEPEQVRVFKGDAKVMGNGAAVTVKDGNLLNLSATTLATAKFDAKSADDMYLWARDRSAYLSAGNMASARSLSSSGYGNSAYAPMGVGAGYAYSGWNPGMWSGFSGGWYYNQYLNMYSYMPFAGTVYSPFGYGYYNPATIGYAYNPGYYWTGSGGSRTGTTTGLPLQSLSTTGPASRPGLPRLGTTATTRPTLASAAPGTQPSGLTSNAGALVPRAPGFGSAQPSAPGNAVSSIGSVRSAAPAPAPVSAPAPAARMAGGRR